ncbi:hypothetical protein AAHZ94_29440 [Streptomyces sp. HSW2009]|uniref:hypothetical protein n=1 Tax=Streptomyces sp. HSW2009 TaxID=3142890 RepID=UPI0032EC6133
MPQRATPTVPAPVREPESLAELRADCALMAPHWPAPGTAGRTAPPVGPGHIRGVRVPAASAHLVDGMSEYGD